MANNQQPTTNNQQPTGLIILAAGASTRMGTPKQLLLRDDRPLIRYVIETAIASLCQPILVVLGCESKKIRPHLESLPVEIRENSDWPEGMSASIRVGLQALVRRSPEVEGAVFTVCDQPWLSVEAIDNLVQCDREDCPIIASCYNNTLGVPALFRRSIFPELLALKGATGAKKVINRNLHRVASIPFTLGAIDLDTLREYRAFRETIKPTAK